MQLPRIINAVYSRPWAITADKHAAIRTALEAYINGASFPDFDPATTEETLSIVGSVAVLNIEGTIVPKASGLEAMCGLFSLEQFRKDLRAAASNNDVKSIILNIASGGGMITGVPETADHIAEVARSKNVVAYTGDIAASAAYWLACQANRVFMSKSAEVGSIGVYLALLDVTRAMEQEGVKLELFKAGDFKAMGMPGKPLSDAERELLQAGVDKAYRQFTGYVKAKRPSVPTAAMQGQCLDLDDALRYGLVDGEINSLDSLIDYLNAA